MKFKFKNARLRSVSVIFIFFTLIGGCSSVDVHDYSEFSPKLDVFEFFQGTLVASGVVKNRSGRVIRYFNADIQAYVEGDTLVLDETFLFSDGEKDFRKWQIKRSAEATFEGEANDINGVAVGEASGNALRWKYDMNLTSKGRSIEVEFDDWMFQTDENTIINISDIKKWGFKVGEVVLVIIRSES